jgi:flagellar hook-associated protein 2
MSSVTSTTSAASSTASALSQLIANTGNSSGLNDSNIIAQLVSIESLPIQHLKTQQSALQSQISVIGQISSALQSLASASNALEANGVVGLTAGSNTAFTAAASLGAQQGTYQIQVTQLAQAAKSRSQGFAATDTATGGTLNLSVQGTSYAVSVADGASLSSIAADINGSGAAVSASVISDGTKSYLSVTNSNLGYPTTGTGDTAMTMTFDATGTQGKAIAFTAVQPAKNAALTIDGLAISSQSNTVSKAIPGITLNLVALDAAPETMNIRADVPTTAANLQTFVNAYNGVMRLVQGQLAVTSGSDRTTTLAGDPTLRNLQQRLQNMFTATISEASDINSLPAMGLTTSYSDGSLSLDTNQLSAALALDPNAVNAMFGISADSFSTLASRISTDYTSIGNGALSARTQGLNSEISDLSTQEDSLQAQVKTYQANLVAQFANMETIVSSLKSTSSYLTSQANASKSG